MHSARWDSEYDLKGKTVAVIGGGSSAVQIVPQIQPSEFRSSSKAVFTKLHRSRFKKSCSFLLHSRR